MKLSISGARPSAVAVVLGWVLMTGMPVTSVEAQDPPVSPIAGLPAKMVTRLAEAADGYRVGANVWIVATPGADDGRILGVYTDLDSAVAVMMAVPGTEVYGPLLTPRDFGALPRFLIGCHVRPSIWLCPWQEPFEFGTPFLEMESVDSVGLTVFSGGGALFSEVIDPMEVDALFFTMSAMDKFLLPYYAQLYGTEYANRMRASIEERIRD